MRKKIISTLFVLTMLLSVAPGTLPAQEKKHLTFYDTFFGSEDNYQVCYPKEHRTFFYQIIIYGALAIVLLGYIVWSRSRNNKILKQKNKQIEEQNKEMLDSIKYASHLQRTLIPSAEVRNNCGKALQVIYKPKDIVSGDFYWIKKKEDLLFLAVIDCTGHGVPGAFLSVLAHNAIERAVNEHQLKEPARILDDMNTYVKEVLKQQHAEGIKDGMEAGLVVINTKTNVLQYAGANIDLAYWQKGEMKEIHAAKCTVGSVQEHVVSPPQNHELQMQTGDRFFMFSDGFPDQFGGDKNKKLGKKRLKELLGQSAGKTTEEQLREVCAFYDSWKGKNEQTDDIVLMMAGV